MYTYMYVSWLLSASSPENKHWREKGLLVEIQTLFDLGSSWKNEGIWTFDLAWSSSIPQGWGVPVHCVCVVWNSLAPKLYVHVHVYAGLHFGVLFYGKGYVTNNCLINHLKCLDVCNVITIQRSPISWHCLVVEEYHIQYSQWYYTLLPHFEKVFKH